MSQHHAAAISQVMGLVLALTKHRSQQKHMQLTVNLEQQKLTAKEDQDRAAAIIAMKAEEAKSHFMNRQMDLVVETFRATHQLIANHHASLIEERRELRNRRYEASETQQIALGRMIGDIQVELFNLAKMSALISLQANRMALEIGSPIRLPNVPLIT